MEYFLLILFKQRQITLISCNKENTTTAICETLNQT